VPLIYRKSSRRAQDVVSVALPPHEFSFGDRGSLGILDLAMIFSGKFAGESRYVGFLFTELGLIYQRKRGHNFAILRGHIAVREWRGKFAYCRRISRLVFEHGVFIEPSSKLPSGHCRRR